MVRAVRAIQIDSQSHARSGARLQISRMMHIKKAAIFILVGVAAFFAFRRSAQKPELDTRSVVTQVRQLNQLATVRYTVQKVIGIREPKGSPWRGIDPPGDAGASRRRD